VEVPIVPGMTARLPSGMIEIDGVRAGLRRPAPYLGEHTEQVLSELRHAEPHPGPNGKRPDPRAPLKGLRVLDLGVIVVW
jgi:hypothetical protein